MMRQGISILRGVVVVILVVGGAVSVCHADVPQLMNYQARLTDSGDTPLNGTYDLTFRLYEGASGGTALWTETHTTVTVTDGYVSLILGSIAPFPAMVFSEPPRYLGVQVDGDPEMSPRSQLLTVPYAFQSERAQGLIGSPGQCFDAPNPPITEPSIAAGITDTMTVSGAPTSITNVTCTVDFNPVFEVVSLWLESPNGTRVYLSGIQFGGSIVANFDNDRFPETGSMDDFDGEDANGVWTLQFQSGTGLAGQAVLNSWRLCFDGQPCTLCQYAVGHRLDLSLLRAREIRLQNDSSSDTVKITGSDGRLVLGGEGAWGGIRVQTGTGGPIFRTDSSGTFIGGSGVNGMLWLMPPSGGSRILLRGSDGSIDMQGTLTVGQNVDVTGNLTVTGTKSAAVKTREGVVRAVYCDESAEVYLFDRGRGRLVNGKATIRLDPTFLQTVTASTEHPLWVQITPTASCNGIYVKKTSARSFSVEELMNGRSNATFNWEVGAKRRGFEDRRLEPIGR